MALSIWRSDVSVEPAGVPGRGTARPAAWAGIPAGPDAGRDTGLDTVVAA
jgi:hypothetical protein